MATKWTQAQQSAINQRNKTLLLSAAAGSGKTSTLTERIIRSITDKENPADISRMLIVTFTRASATDLKTKIFNAVSNALADDPSNKHLTHQLIKLGSANISTIDSFYLAAVRENFSALGLSSSFRIADESETILIAKNVLEDVINRFYDTDASFSALCECFEKLRDTEGVMEEILLSLYIECMRTPEGVVYLKRCSENTLSESTENFLDTSFGKILTKSTRSFFECYLCEYEKILESISADEHLYRAYYDAFDSDRMLCIKALNILEGKTANASYIELSELLCAYTAPSLRSIGKFASEYSVYCKALRDKFKADFTKLRDQYFCYTQNDFAKFFMRTSDNLNLLYRVLSEFDREYTNEKKRRNILELTDVKRLALKLFATPEGTPTELAKRFSEQFTDIYIDEYQDVDPVQDLIFRCISTPTNRFMVGDIKQSIYSFRGAHPQLFADYRAEFPTHGSADADTSNCETIFMSENFRCSKSVIDFTNLVCADIFRACKDSIGYTADDDLVYSKMLPDGAAKDSKVTIAVFAKNKKQAHADSNDTETLLSPAEAEAKYIAHEIHRLITTEKKQDGSPIRPSDIAILFRNKSFAKRLTSALNDVGITCSNTESSQYFSNPDVVMMLCILNSIDNPQRDIQLAGAMRSPVFGFTLEDLLLINRYGSRADSLYDKVVLCSENKDSLGTRCTEFLCVLEQWRSMSVSLPIDKLLSRIFASETFVASGLACEKNALGEGGNLKLLYEYARTFEAGSFKGLYNFIEFINALIENGKTIEARSEGSTGECVTLTTIHKSKGLEFPICFVCNAASPFNTSSSNANLTFEYGSGVAMTLSDDTGFAQYISPLKKVLDGEAHRKGVEEEMRVLYVALTRAKERLYVTGNYSKAVMPTVLANAEFANKVSNTHFILSASSYMDWILPAIKQDSADAFSRLCAFTTDMLPDFSVNSNEIAEPTTHDGFNEQLYRQLKDKFSFEYPYIAQRRIPAKLSVSKLSPSVLDESDISVSLFDSEQNPSVPDFFLSSSKKASAAERGTATHLFLQFCDFHLLKNNGVKEALAILTEKKYIPSKIAECVYIEELEKFRNSELMEEILNAKKIIREQRFNILFPATDFSRDDQFKQSVKNEKIAVQGVIDLIVITNDEKICLYDYKTDRLSKSELNDFSLACKKMNNTHGLQLSYYTKAVEYMFGKAPDKTAVYSTHASRLFDISTCELEIPHDIL